MMRRYRSVKKNSGRSKGGGDARDAQSLFGPIFFIFMQFTAKIMPIKGSAPIGKSWIRHYKGLAILSLKSWIRLIDCSDEET